MTGASGGGGDDSMGRVWRGAAGESVTTVEGCGSSEVGGTATVVELVGSTEGRRGRKEGKSKKEERERERKEEGEKPVRCVPAPVWLEEKKEREEKERKDRKKRKRGEMKGKEIFFKKKKRQKKTTLTDPTQPETLAYCV